jgi:hypothetical protein
LKKNDALKARAVKVPAGVTTRRAAAMTALIEAVPLTDPSAEASEKMMSTSCLPALGGEADRIEVPIAGPEALEVDAAEREVRAVDALLDGERIERGGVGGVGGANAEKTPRRGPTQNAASHWARGV